MADPVEKTDNPVPNLTQPEPGSVWRIVRNWIFGMVVLFVVSGAVDVAVGIIFGKKADCSALTSEFAKGVCEADQKTASANTNSSDIEKADCSAIKPDYERGLCEGAQKAAAARKNPKDSEIDCSKRTSSVTKSLCEGNKYVATNVKALDPFNFAGIFYSYLWYGKPPQPQAFYSFSQPVPDAIDPNGKEKKGIISLIIVFLYRAIPGAIYTSLTIASSGWVSIITAVIALLFGYLAVRTGPNEEACGHTLLGLLLVPVIGGAFIWVLIQLMAVAGNLFGNMLEAAEANTAFSVVVSTAWAMFKKTENDVTDKFIKWSKDAVFRG